LAALDVVFGWVKNKRCHVKVFQNAIDNVIMSKNISQKYSGKYVSKR